jgi:hypothetical protein
LREFENRVLRRIFGTKRDKVTGKWRKLQNDELNDPYSSPNIIKVMIIQKKNEIFDHVARMGDRRCVI